MGTGSCSRMASICQKCPGKDTCQNKRMEAMAYIIPDDKLTLSPMAESPCVSSLFEVNIQMPTMEDLSKQINESIARKINLCAFGELRR